VVGDFKASGQFTGSSRKIKKDFENLTDDDYKSILEKVNQLQLVKFRYKHQNETETKTMGIIAEDSPKELVASDKSSVNMTTYSSYAIAAIKAQQREINALKARIDALEAE